MITPESTVGTETPAVQEKPSDQPLPYGGDAVRGTWNISLDDLQRNLSHNSQDAIDVFIACFRWCISDEHPLSVAELAERVQADHTLIRRLFQGKYLHPQTGARLPISEKLLKAMREFLRLEGERMSARRVGFLMTPTARSIFNYCDLARESQTPVFIIGPSHIGKTWALREYTEQNNHGRTIYVRLKAASGLGGMIKAIGAALGISDKANTADMIARIKRGLKSNMLLVLDEVHQLVYTYRKESFFACLEVLREIYDETGAGVVICATDLLFKRVADNRGELEQFFRRGVHKKILPAQPQRGDVAMIAEASGLEMPDRDDRVTVTVNGTAITERPYEMLRQIGKEEGLKAISERLRYGQKLANKARAKLTWEHVVRAHFIIKQAAQPQNDWE
jgi:DNA transposition AAA+ family ATPase